MATSVVICGCQEDEHEEEKEADDLAEFFAAAEEAVDQVGIRKAGNH